MDTAYNARPNQVSGWPEHGYNVILCEKCGATMLDSEHVFCPASDDYECPSCGGHLCWAKLGAGEVFLMLRACRAELKSVADQRNKLKIENEWLWSVQRTTCNNALDLGYCSAESCIDCLVSDIPAAIAHGRQPVGTIPLVVAQPAEQEAEIARLREEIARLRAEGGGLLDFRELLKRLYVELRDTYPPEGTPEHVAALLAEARALVAQTTPGGGERGEVQGSQAWQNIKTGGLYQIVEHVTNSTNDRDGQPMLLYKPVGGRTLYCREVTEFYSKFRRCGQASSAVLSGIAQEKE